MDIGTLSTIFSTILVLITVIVIFFQLREMRKATVATAFSNIVSFLQAEKVREARRVLMNISEKDFTKWTPEQRVNAETACSTFDTVGIMLRTNVINHALVTKEWRFAIIKCWEKAQPMIKSYREERGKDFWDDFEWIYRMAKTATS